MWVQTQWIVTVLLVVRRHGIDAGFVEATAPVVTAKQFILGGDVNRVLRVQRNCTTDTQPGRTKFVIVLALRLLAYLPRLCSCSFESLYVCYSTAILVFSVLFVAFTFSSSLINQFCHC